MYNAFRDARRRAIARPRFRAVIAAAVVFPALVLTACSTGSETSTGGTAKQSGPIKIGALMFARDLEFWQLVEAGMKAAASKEGAEIDVEVSNRNLATEAQVVDTFHAKGDNVLVIGPRDATASIATLKKAAGYGMSIMQYNTRVTDTSFNHFVGVDNTQLGQADGKALVDYVESKMGGKATLGVLACDTQPGGTDRKNGFLSQLKGHDGIKVATTVTAVGSPTDGATAMNTALQAHPDINVVWAWNGAALQGSTVAAQKSHANIKIFGVDMSSQVADIMKSADNPVQAVADQHAYNVGYQAVENAIKIAKGEQVTDDNKLTPVIYTAGDPTGIENFLTELKQAQ
jgi:ribose transport system substrate-binding protein